MRYLLSDGRYVGQGTPFTFNDIQYPANWIALASEAEKEALGLQPVVAVNERADDRYYWVSEELVGATLTYINTPKELDQCKELALKSVDATAYSLLQPTDYIDIRNLRNSSYKLDWMLWRDSVRETAGTAVAAINACESVDDLAALPAIQWPQDPSYVAPIEPSTV